MTFKKIYVNIHGTWRGKIRMNREIYEKLKYQLEEKDRLRKVEKDEYFNKVDRNTLKLYYKIWSEILKSYKKAGLDTIEFVLRVSFEAVENEKYGVTLYSPIQLNKKDVYIDLINLEKLKGYLDSDGIDNEFGMNINEKKFLVMYITENSLRSIETQERKKYPAEKVLKKSVKSTKVKGK